MKNKNFNAREVLADARQLFIDMFDVVRHTYYFPCIDGKFHYKEIGEETKRVYEKHKEVNEILARKLIAAYVDAYNEMFDTIVPFDTSEYESEN